MKKYLLIYAVLVTALSVYGLRHYRSENRRLSQNQTALGTELTRYRTQAGEEAASAQVLRLRCAEFETLREADAEKIRSLGIRLKRLEASATTATSNDLSISAPLRDTVVVRQRETLVVRDTVQAFHWRDTWVSVEGTIRGDTAACRIRSIDTLRQVVHRIPRRFLFLRWGTKALRQEITVSNPHTRIIYSEYVKIEK